MKKILLIFLSASLLLVFNSNAQLTGASVDAVTNITHEGVTLNGEITTSGTIDVDYYFNYGTTSGSLTTQAPNPATTLADLDGTQSVDEAISGLSAETQYFYELYAEETVDNTQTATSTEGSFWTYSNVTQTAVAGFQRQSATTTSITLEWTAQTGNIAGYLIVYDESGSAPDETALQPGTAPWALSYTDSVVVHDPTITEVEITQFNGSALTPNTQYSFRIIPFNKGANDATTNYQSTVANTTVSTYTLENVTGLAIQNFDIRSKGETNIELEWTAETTDNDGYLILWAEGPNAPVPADVVVLGIRPLDQPFSNKIVRTGSSSNSQNINTGLDPGKEYSFVIIPYNRGDDDLTTNYNVTTNSEVSTFTLAEEPNDNPGSPTFISSTPTSITLEFAKSDGATPADGYFITYQEGTSAPSNPGAIDGTDGSSELAEADVDGTFTIFSTDATISATIPDLSPGTEYSFRIMAFSSDATNNPLSRNYKTNGITFQNNGLFTLATEPTSAITGFEKTTATETQINFKFDEYTTFADDGGFVLYYQQGGSVPDISDLRDGFQPSDQPILALDYGIQNTDAATTINTERPNGTVGNINSGLEYSAILVPFNFIAGNFETINYGKAAAFSLESVWSLAAAASGGAVADAGYTVDNATSTSLDVTYTAVTNADGYLILYSEGSAAFDITDVIDGQSPAQIDAALPAGVTLLDNGTAVTETIESLNADTDYSFYVIPYTFAEDAGSPVDETYNYNNASPILKSGTTLCSTGPSAGSASIANDVGALTTTSIKTDLSNVPVDAENLVVARLSSDALVAPSDGVTYTANAVFGSGAQTGSGNDVVLAGAGTSVTTTSLSPFTEYEFDYYVYNPNGHCYSFVETILVTTLCEPATTTVTGTSTSGISFDEITVNWTIQGAGNNVLVVARENSDAAVAPVSNTDYAESPIFGNGATTGTGNFTVYDGGGTSITVTGLEELTNYSFDIYEYNPTNGGFCYNLTDPAVTESTNTDCEPPSTSSTFNAVTELTAGSVDLNWTVATGADGYLVVAKQGSTVDLAVVNSDDFTAIANSNFLDPDNEAANGNMIVYSAAGTSVTITGLTAGTQYTFEVYAYVNSSFCYAFGPDAQTITTLASSNNNTLTLNSAAASISSVDNDQSGTYVTVMDFDMRDLGGDGIPTRLASFAFNQGTGNDFADWTAIIQDARVVNVTNSNTTHATAANITANTIGITVGASENNGSGKFGYINDNSSVNMQLQIRLKSAIALAQIDELNFVFELDPGSIITQGNSSGFATTLGSEITTNATDNEVEVLATAFEFTTDPPAAANAGVNVTPQAVVQAKDRNGNLDFGYGNFTISNADNIPMDNLPLNPSFTNGEFEFPATFNYQGSGDGTLTLTDGANQFTFVSNLIKVNPTVDLTEITGGLNGGTLQSGTTNQAVLGWQIDPLGTTQVNSIEFTTDFDITPLVNNLRLVASADNIYDAADSPITSSLNVVGGNTITFSSLTENFSSEAKSYFLIVDVEETVNVDTPPLTFLLDINDIAFSNTANKNASSFSKQYGFEDITKPEVSEITATPNVLSGANLGNDALEIKVTFNEKMDDAIIPNISFPAENPNNSITGPTASSGWSADSTFYSFFFNLADADEWVENIDVSISGANDKYGNALDDFTEVNLFTIDTENPIADAINLDRTLVNRSQNTIEVSIKFDKAMNNSIDPTVEADVSNNLINNADGVWTEEVIGNGFNIYTVSLTHDLAVEEDVLDKLLISGAEDVAGNIMNAAESPDFSINTTRSRIDSITAINLSGIYKAGDIISIQVHFDQDIIVASGIPELDLNSGGTAVFDNVANNIITFNYEVLAGENIALLDVTAINLIGSTITNAAGNNAILTLASSPNRLQDNKNIEIDTQSPEISATTIDPLMVSQTNSTFTLEVSYNEDMDQSSSLGFSFSTGNNISFQSGTWLDAQTYEAEFEHDLLVEEEFDNVTIDISGATDVVGNTAVTSSSIPFDIDTRSPRITEIISTSANRTYGPGETINIRVVFAENIQQLGTAPSLTLNTGATAVFDNITNGKELNFTYTIGSTGSGENTSDLNVSAISMSENEILDLVDNPSVLSLPASPNQLADNSNLIIDTTSPTFTIDLDNTSITIANNQLVLTATFDEDMDQTSVVNFNVPNTANLDLVSDGWNSATEYIATFTHDLTEEKIQSVSIDVSGGTDVVGNPAIANTSENFSIDTQKPRITEIRSTSPNGLYSPGDPINVQLVFDEEVTVGGSPLVNLNTGGQASFLNVTNGNEVNFVYTVGSVNSGQNTLDLDVTSFDMNGGNIRDLVSNDAEIELPLAPDRLQDNSDIQVDTDPASIDNVTSAKANGFYTVGEIIDIQIEFNEPSFVTGSPSLKLNTGDEAVYVSGSGSSVLTFNYTIQAANGNSLVDVSDLNYDDVIGIILNGGTITDEAGISATLSLPPAGAANSLGGNKDITIDTQDPILANNPFTPVNGQFNVSQSLTFTIELNEPVSGQGTANISIVNKETSQVLEVLDAGTAFSNNTTNILAFTSFESFLEDSTEYYIQFQAGALVDRAGNEFAGFTANNIWSFTTFGPARIDDFSIGACVGELFTIQGQYFTGVSRIRTNVGGTNPFTISSFTVIDDENIQFTVPAGTVPGTITLDKQSGQAGNTENASTTSAEPIKVGPSSAQLTLVDPSETEICDIDDLGDENEVEFTVDIVGGSGIYTLVYQVNAEDPVTITGYEDGQTFSVLPPDSALNTVSIVSLTDEDVDLNTCSAPNLGADVEVVKYIRSRVDAGGFESEDNEFGIIELCGANTNVVDFANASLVTNRPEITGTVQQGRWTIDDGPSSNGGGFSPDFSLKSVQTDRPDTVKYYASFADGVRGQVTLELTSDDPGGLNPCIGTSDFVLIRFVETISVNTDRNVSVCLDENENGELIASTVLSSAVSGGSAADSIGILWARVDNYEEEAEHDGSWGFKDDENQASFSLTSNVLNPIYKASPQEVIEGRSTVEALPILVSGTGCGPAPTPREVTIRINDIPNPTKSTGPAIVCSGEQEVRFRMNPSSAGNTFEWKFTAEENEFDGATNSNLVFINFRNVEIETIDTLLVQEFNPTTGCISKLDTFFITLKPLPIANIRYNSTTTISNSADLIPLIGEGGVEGNLVQATSVNGQFSGPGVIRSSNGNYFLDSRQLEVTDITDEEDVHEIIFTYTNEFGCSSSDTIVFNVFAADRIFRDLAEGYCQLDPSFRIKVDPAIVPDGFEVSTISGPGISNIIINDSTRELTALFDPETAYAENIEEENPSTIAITYSIVDPNNAANNVQNVGAQIVIVNPLPVMEIDDIETNLCSYDENLEFEPIGNVGTNFSFRILNEDISDTLMLGNSTDGFEMNLQPLDQYLIDENKESVEIFVEYTLTNQNSCTNSRIYSFVVWRRPFQPDLEATDLCIVNEVVATARVNYDGTRPNEELIWLPSQDFTTDPDVIIATGDTFVPDAEFFTTTNTRTFYVFRLNVNSSGEADQSCVSFPTAVTYRKINNPSFSWTKSTYGVEDIVFTGEFNQIDLDTAEWTITRLSDGEEIAPEHISISNITNAAVDFNSYGAGRYRVNFKVFTKNACSSEITEDIIILPEQAAEAGRYIFNFDNSTEGWVSDGLKRNSTDTVRRVWDFALPTGDSNFETDEPVWITNAEGSYESGIVSYVYSPSMDISAIDRPVLSFDLWLNMAAEEDGLVLEYSTDGRRIEDTEKTWQVLGNLVGDVSSGLEWYNEILIEALEGTGENTIGVGWSFENDAESIGAVNAKHALDEIEDKDSLIFRFQFRSTSSENQFGNRDGAAFDNFKIESLNRNVLVEYFGNFQSLIVDDAQEMENINNEFTEKGNFTWINYRVNENDPLYKQQSSTMLSRVYYYDAYDFAGRFAIDGIVRNQLFSQNGGDFGSNELSRARLFSSLIDFNAFDVSVNDDEMQIEVSFQSVEPLEDNVHLYIAVLQKEAVGAIEGVTYYNVLRKLLPGNSGIAVSGTSGQQTVTFRATRPQDENPLAVVAFLQNIDTREVLQSAYVEGFPELSFSNVTSIEKELSSLDIKLYPNPARDYLNIFWNTPLRQQAKAKVIDIAGKIIKEFTLDRGDSNYELKTSNLKTGMYNLILTNQEGEYKILKFTITN